MGVRREESMTMSEGSFFRMLESPFRIGPDIVECGGNPGENSDVSEDKGIIWKRSCRVDIRDERDENEKKRRKYIQTQRKKLEGNKGKLQNVGMLFGKGQSRRRTPRNGGNN